MAGLRGVLTATRTVSDQPALPHAGLGAALCRMRRAIAYPAARLALELLVLTAARSGEVREAPATARSLRYRPGASTPMTVKTLWVSTDQTGPATGQPSTRRRGGCCAYGGDHARRSDRQESRHLARPPPPPPGVCSHEGSRAHPHGVPGSGRPTRHFLLDFPSVSRDQAVALLERAKLILAGEQDEAAA